ncbi:MAG TPA: DCC1-like thiol-disulfide oxidoreductase family protein [Rhizomicrobium sp.]|jgi:predicted DCC family thiol-disulfide oxidoreductase YuxK|nr:DCC1-like thiol-disulfide oxidoreductase family protein [Rhizomicrobium sp.]
MEVTADEGETAGTPGRPALVIYDGDCVFCQNYVKFVKLKEAVGPVELLDARSGDPRLSHYWVQGYDLNEGMLFVYRGRVYHGHDAVNMLALLSSNSSVFNRLNQMLLSNRKVAAAVYPLLKLGRRLVLALRNKTLIAAPTGG